MSLPFSCITTRKALTPSSTREEIGSLKISIAKNNFLLSPKLLFTKKKLLKNVLFLYLIIILIEENNRHWKIPKKM